MVENRSDRWNARVMNSEVSVVIATFNSGEYLAATLDSVLAQSGCDFEIVLVDDGSTDNTRDIAARYGRQVHYLRQENSGGPARPRNVGIAHSRGKYISIFDSDDIMLPGKLARAVECLDAHAGLGMLFTDFQKFDVRGPHHGTHLQGYADFRALQKTFLGSNLYRIESRLAFEALFGSNFIGTSSVVARAEVMRSVGPFDESVTRGGLEDRDMWFRIARRYDLGYLDAVCHRYRVRPGSVSRRTIDSAGARIKVIRRHLSPELTSAVRRQARSSIAESYFNMGAQHWLEGNLHFARACYWKSLRERPNGRALYWLLLSLLGTRALTSWRWIRARMQKSLPGGHA
jgi:glycosyltransferase involved in cell wall biosynthesis